MTENIYIEDFLNSMRVRKYSVKSIERYEQSIKNFIRFLDSKKIKQLQEIDLKTLESYRLDLIRKNYSDHSVESFLQGVKLFFSFLAAESFIFENPALKLTIRRARPKLGYVMNDDEVRKLLASPDISTPTGLRDRAVMEVLYATGIRRKELIRIKIFDADCKNKTLRIMGKGSKERMLPLGKHASDYVGIYLKNARPKLSKKKSLSDMMWLNYAGHPLSEQSASILVRRHVVNADLDRRINQHCLRRTCATHLLRNGAHPLLVSKLLGHSDVRTLSHYLQVSIVDLMESHAKSKPGG